MKGKLEQGEVIHVFALELELERFSLPADEELPVPGPCGSPCP
ncbi:MULTISPECIES: hypothetical protein [Sorangium]|nr:MULTISPECIES: hypothetical protein [Sorangium]